MVTFQDLVLMDRPVKDMLVGHSKVDIFQTALHPWDISLSKAVIRGE